MTTKNIWNNEQQEYLRQIVQNRNTKNLTWNQIAIEMNKIFPQKCRTGKQYRERYVNYVQFVQNNTKNNLWTLQQQQQLFKTYREIGTKWTLIAKIIPTKSQNSLKNKFYGALRKTLRKINRIGKQNIKKFNKLIRYQSIMRIMDAAEGGEDLPQDIKNNSIEIKKFILELAQNSQQQFNIDIVSQTIKKIHKFNIATRCYSSKKWKKSPHHNNSHNNQCSNIDTNSQIYSPDELQQAKQINYQNILNKKTKKIQQQSRQQQQNNQQIKLQQNNQNEYLNKIKQQNKQSYQNISIQAQNNIRKDSLQQLQALYDHNVNSSLLKDDLDFELCGILHQNYVPQYFNYFEQQ